jgi:hypothetical protein
MTLDADIELIPRSKCDVVFAYTVEHQAPDGGWVKSYATDDCAWAMATACYDQNHGQTVRVVEEGV